MRALEFGNLIERVEELPRLKGKSLFLDLETTSGDPKKHSKSPWRDCHIGGIALKNENSPIFYVPVHHNEPYTKYNLPRESVIKWMEDIYRDHQEFVNQNVKYDAHVIYNDFGLEFHGDLVCTIHALAAPNDSERVYKGGYGLDVLARDILGEDITGWEDKVKLYLRNTEDYGDVCPTVLGAYACKDVEIVERLTHALPRKPITPLEIKVTKALLNIERRGFYVNVPRVDVEEIMASIKMYTLENKIYDLLGAKTYLNPSSSKDMKRVFLDILGLPILGWTDSEEPSPSFATDVLKEYLDIEGVPDGLVEACLEYREWKTYKGLFLKAFNELNVNGLLRPWYNQTVRSGRMSCSKPNAQQQNELSKKLIEPRRGFGFARYDYSQIEFRIIAHYIGWVDGYIKNPDLDFYQGVADDASCDRDPAKVIALGGAYGMGMKSVVKNVSKLKMVQSSAHQALLSYSPTPDKRAVIAKAEEIGRNVYHKFHNSLPSLSSTAKKAEEVCIERGYVRTMMGRERHLDRKFARKAFNTICQGSAADLIKAKLVEFEEKLRHLPDVNLILQVHDELVFEAPEEIIKDPRFHRDVIAIMEDNPLPMKVPLRAHGGYSLVNLAEAKPKKGSEAIQNPFGTKGEDFRWI